jgi:hypothetical protein
MYVCFLYMNERACFRAFVLVVVCVPRVNECAVVECDCELVRLLCRALFVCVCVCPRSPFPMSPVKLPVKSLAGQHVFLLPLKEPHTDVPGDDDFVLQVSEPPDLLHLLVDVLLVFDDVGFACEHARRRGVLGADVDDGELPSGLEDAPDFSEHLVPSCPGRLVERVHDGDEVKGSLLEERFFCVSSDEAQEVAGGLGEGLERMVEGGFEAGVRRLHFGQCEHLRQAKKRAKRRAKRVAKEVGFVMLGGVA